MHWQRNTLHCFGTYFRAPILLTVQADWGQSSVTTLLLQPIATSEFLRMGHFQVCVTRTCENQQAAPALLSQGLSCSSKFKLSPCVTAT